MALRSSLERLFVLVSLSFLSPLFGVIAVVDGGGVPLDGDRPKCRIYSVPYLYLVLQRI